MKTDLLKILIKVLIYAFGLLATYLGVSSLASCSAVRNKLWIVKIFGDFFASFRVTGKYYILSNLSRTYLNVVKLIIFGIICQSVLLSFMLYILVTIQEEYSARCFHAFMHENPETCKKKSHRRRRF